MNEDETVNRGLKLIAKSSVIVFIGLFSSKIFVYIYRIIIARRFGPEVYGLFALSIMVIGWFRVVSDLGIKQGLLRYVSLFRGKKEKGKIQHLLRISFFVLICTSILAGILLFFFSKFIALEIFSNPNLIIFLKIFSIVIPIAVLGEALLSVLRAYEKIGWYSFITNILGNFVKLIILIFFIFIGINSTSVPISYLIGAFSILVVAYFVCKITLSGIFNLDKKIINPKSKKVFKEMFSYAWPLLFYGVVAFTFYWVDSFMIGIFKPIEHVGFYNAAVPIAMLLYLPLSLFLQLFFPLVTKEFSKGNIKAVKQLSQQVGKWTFMLVMPFFILLILFPGVFINVFFGKEYIVAANALRFLSIGTLFSIVFSISYQLLSIKGKSKLLLIDMIFAGILNIILNFILVPLYGITGAGFATMVSLIILSMLFFIQAHKHLSIVPLRKKMLKISLMIILSTILLLIIKSFVKINLLSLIFCGIFFIAVYTLLILTTNCLDGNDISILRSIFKKFKRNTLKK